LVFRVQVEYRDFDFPVTDGIVLFIKFMLLVYTVSWYAINKYVISLTGETDFFIPIGNDVIGPCDPPSRSHGPIFNVGSTCYIQDIHVAKVQMLK
jgi:hypothetical protein